MATRSSTEVADELGEAVAAARRRDQRAKSAALVRVLDEWLAVTNPAAVQDQQETWTLLERALAEDPMAVREASP